MKVKSFSILLSMCLGALLLYQCSNVDTIDKANPDNNPISTRVLSAGDYHTAGSVFILEYYFDSLIYLSGNKVAQVDLIERRLNQLWSMNKNLDPLIFTGLSGYIFTDAFVADFDNYRTYMGTLTSPLSSAELDIMEDWFDESLLIDPFDSVDRADYLAYLDGEKEAIVGSLLPHKNILISGISVLNSSVKLWPEHYDNEYGPGPYGYINRRCLWNALWSDLEAYTVGTCSDSPDDALAVACSLAVSLLEYEDCVD